MVRLLDTLHHITSFKLALGLLLNLRMGGRGKLLFEEIAAYLFGVIDAFYRIRFFLATCNLVQRRVSHRGIRTILLKIALLGALQTSFLSSL